MTTDNKTLPVFRFARYVNGIRMAEGVTIEKAENLPEAMRTAAKLATIGHGGDVPVLVHEPSSLADVQPGGRVKLGEQPWPEIDAILADAYSAGATGLPFEGIARRHAVRAAVAALSAQPSPGGQRDDSPMAKMAAALRGKAEAERAAFDQRVQSGEWGPMPDNPDVLELPPLPEEVDSVRCMIRGEKGFAEPCDYYFTSKQMRDYARTALAARQPVADQHPDDLAVDAFATAMKAKMADARAKGRGGWEDPAQCTADDLSRMLRDHVEKGDTRDVANFCMMLHQRGETIAARQPVGEIPSEVLSAISGLAHIAKANVPSLADKHVAIIDAWLYAALPAQAVDLAADHHGMRVDYHGLLRQVQGGLRSDPALAEMVRQLHDHLTELGKRWYAGDRKVVDELLQLYGIEDGARRALTDSQAVGNG